MYPRGLETGWCQSSSGGGRSRCLIDIGDSFERSPSRCGGRPCVCTGHERASITRGHRGGWRYGVNSQSCGLHPHFPVTRSAKWCLLGVGGSTGRRLSPSTCIWDFPGWCFTMKPYSSSAANQRWRRADAVRIVFSHCKA